MLCEHKTAYSIEKKTMNQLLILNASDIIVHKCICQFYDSTHIGYNKLKEPENYVSIHNMQMHECQTFVCKPSMGKKYLQAHIRQIEAKMHNMSNKSA